MKLEGISLEVLDLVMKYYGETCKLVNEHEQAPMDLKVAVNKCYIDTVETLDKIFEGSMKDDEGNETVICGHDVQDSQQT